MNKLFKLRMVWNWMLMAFLILPFMNVQGQSSSNLLDEGGDERFSAIIETNDGGFAIVGQQADDFGAAFDKDIYFLKLDTDGQLQYSRTFGEANQDESGEDLVQTADGGFLLALSGSDNSVLRLNAQGEPIGSFDLGIDAKHMALDADGRLTLYNNQMALFADAAGNLLRSIDYRIPQERIDDPDPYRVITISANISHVAQTADQGFVMAGVRAFSGGLFPFGQSDIFVRKVDQEGEEEWIKYFASASGVGRKIQTVQEAADGSILFSWMDCTSGRFCPGSIPTVWRLDSTGEFIWSQPYCELYRGFAIPGQIHSALDLPGVGLAAIGYCVSEGTAVKFLNEFGQSFSLTAVPNIPINNNGNHQIYEQPNGALIFAGSANNNQSANDIYFFKTQPPSPANKIDLEVTLEANKDVPAAFTNVDYTLTVTNKGPINATGVELSFPRQDGLAFVSQTVSKGSYEEYAGLWQVGELAPGESATVEVTLFTLTTDRITSYAQVIKANETDLDSSPRNGLFQVANEDDEAVVTINFNNGPSLPDLVIANFSIDSNTKMVRTEVSGRFDILNPGASIVDKAFVNSTELARDPQGTDIIAQFNSRVLYDFDTDQRVTIEFDFFVPAVESGTYYLITKLDRVNAIDEVNETNNSSVLPLEVLPFNYRGLVIESASCLEGIPQQTGQQLPGQIVIRNSSSSNSPPTPLYLFHNYLPRYQSSGSARRLATIAIPALAPGQSSTINYTATLGSTFMPFSLIADELFFSYNIGGVAKAYIGPDLFCQEIETDLSLELSTLDNTYLPNSDIDYEIRVINNGPEKIYNAQVLFEIFVGTSASDSISLSKGTTAIISNGVRTKYRVWRIPSLEVGESATANVNWQVYTQDEFQVKHTIKSGHLVDANLSNNTDSLLFTKRIRMTNGPDLELSAEGPVFYSAFQTVPITYTLTNTGSRIATGIQVNIPKPDGTVYSGGNEFTASQGAFEFWNSNNWQVGSLAPGATATIEIRLFTLQETAPLTSYGQVTLMNEIDADSSPGNGSCCTASEDDEAVVTIRNGGNGLADVTVSNFQILSKGKAGDRIPFTFNLNNYGTVVAQGDYRIAAFLSTDDNYSNDDLEVGDLLTGNTPTGTIADVNDEIIVPTLSPGNYYLILVADVEGDVPESDESNNIISTPFEIESSSNNGLVDIQLNKLLNTALTNPANNQFVYNLTVNNQGPDRATNIVIGPLANGEAFLSSILIPVNTSATFNDATKEIYIASLDANQGIQFSLNYRLLNPGESADLFFEVKELDQNDADSSPNNGTCCVANEDDEIYTKINEPIITGVDLELSMESTNDQPGIWGSFPVIVRLRNNGNLEATGIAVQFSGQSRDVIYSGGNEYQVSKGTFVPYVSTDLWQISSLLPGEEAYIQFNLFSRTASSFRTYAQVYAQAEPDVDSSPGQGWLVEALEDDEAELFINAGSIANRAGFSNTETEAIFTDLKLHAIYPTPAQEVVYLRIQTREAIVARARIFDLNGQEVLRKTWSLAKGINEEKWNIGELSAGSYFLQLMTDGQQLSRRLIKLGD